MSESDDSDILADIQALDEALALSVKPHSRCPSRYSDDSPSDNFDDLEVNTDCLNYLTANQSIDESLNAYEINTRLITGLTIAKKKLITLLEVCEQKIQLLDEKMESKERSISNLKSKLNNAGVPYFKDKNYFSPPKNDDTKLKEARNELFLLSLKKPSRWSRKDRETLLGAIHNQAIETVLSRQNVDKKSDLSTLNNQAEKATFVLPKNFNEMVEAMGEKDFDWYKISIADFYNKHSPGECRAMWNVYLHPNIKKSEWTSEEDKKLLKCAREHCFQDWDAITQKLGTNRSAYQCFIRYNTIKKVPGSGHVWTRQEDRHLIKLVNAIRVGDYIPWSEVSNHMRHRTKQQIYVRWMYSSAPHLKKGRFNKAETSTLLKAVRKHGMNFSKISSDVMPHRTSVQLQLRYETVMMNINNKFSNSWTVGDDLRLINLHMKYKNDWSKISTYFSSKTRTQVRHRYYAIVRYTMRGISIENIPRPTPTYIRQKITIDRKLSSSNMPKCHRAIVPLENPKQYPVSVFEIQLRLYETLSFPPSAKSNNSDEEPYSIEQLMFDTKKLYNTLKLLNAKLTIPYDIVNYVHLNSRKKQLLISLRDHLNIGNNEVQNNELIEQFRMRMFGNATEGDNGNFFIPPLPFGGYVRKRIGYVKKSQARNMSTDYDLDVNKKFLIDVPEHFSASIGILDFISIDEVIQFDRFSQLLINDCRNYDQQNARLFNSLPYILHLKKDPDNSNKAPTECNESNANTNVEDYEELRETSINKANEMNISDIILPNRATLLGWKNLLLWKLLYECQDEVRQEVQQQCESIARYRGFGNDEVSRQTATNSGLSAKTKSAEYQLLQTRLLQLFKLPISLSNTTLKEEMDMIFQRDKIAKQDILKKRKRNYNTRSTQKNKKVHLSNDSDEDEIENSDPLRMDVAPETT